MLEGKGLFDRILVFVSPSSRCLIIFSKVDQVKADKLRVSLDKEKIVTSEMLKD